MRAAVTTSAAASAGRLFTGGGGSSDSGPVTGVGVGVGVRVVVAVLLVGLAAIVLNAAILASLALTAEWTMGSLGIWAIVIANLLAVVAMGWQTWRAHPVLRQRLEHAPVDV